MDLHPVSLALATPPVASPWDPSDGFDRDAWEDSLPWEEGEWSPLWAHWLEDDGVRMSDAC